ncbi:MAG TPA: FapA family protein, partial [Treponemataceae bacterium]|nr:FapA family protein [Treponemataceae bacterium]
LVGGECIVIGGVQALDIGNSRGTPTRIRCGTDFTVQQELDIANEQLKQLTLKIQKAEETMREAPTDELKSLIESLSQRKAEIANRIPTYLPRIDRNDGAFVEVRGTIFPGVELEICHVPYPATKPQRQVVFKLDKSRGMIIAEPFKKS